MYDVVTVADEINTKISIIIPYRLIKETGSVD